MSPVLRSAPALFTDLRCRLGESPVWDAESGRLLWCDILAGEILSVDEQGGDLRRWSFPDRVGSFGLCESGRWVVALAHGVHLYDPKTEALAFLADPEPAPPTNRLNDGKVGPDGAFWVGSMDDRPERQPLGALYRVTADGRVEKKLDGLIVANGLAWSADGRTMFHSDSRGRWIDAHDFDPATGSLANRRRIAVLTEDSGRPDGAACDAEGCYWSAGVSAGRLNRFDSGGRLLETIVMPMPACTMPCFGGKDLKTLFVTSLSEGFGPEVARHPNAGRLAVMRVGVPGAPVHRFRDRP
jgi:sugar lactone lactonase YvrE